MYNKNSAYYPVFRYFQQFKIKVALRFIYDILLVNNNEINLDKMSLNIKYKNPIMIN